MPEMTAARSRVAIVGHGAVAHIHAHALMAMQEADLVAVVGRTRERAEPFAQEFGTEAFANVATAVESAAVDFVVIATPHPTHAEVAVAAARAGAHALIEKPLATSLSDCDRILGAAEIAGTIVGVVSQRRFLEPVVRMKAAIDRGLIGKPVLTSVSLLGWRDPQYYESDPWRGTWDGEGGGLLVNQAVHHLDLMLWLAGPFDEVFGYWANLNHPDIEVDDTAVAVLRATNGSLASIVASNSQHPGIHARIVVHGESGTTLGVQTDGGSMFVAGSSQMQDAPYNHVWTIPGDEELVSGWKRDDHEEFWSGDPILRYHKLVLRDFVASTRSGGQPAVPGAEGRHCVELIQAIYTSNEKRIPVRLGPAAPLSAGAQP